MLNVMRENLRHLKWVLWIVAIAMTMYLGAFFFNDDRSDPASADWAAMVNETPISARLFLQNLRQRDEYFRQVLGDQYETFRPQLSRQVLQEFINNEVMLQEARKLGLKASPEEISQLILENPSFRGPDGSFVGKEQYTRILQQYPGGAAGYEQALADSITVTQWQSLVTSPVQISDQDVRDLFRDRFDVTEVDFVVVTSSKAADDISQEISPDDLQGWYDDHQDDYMRGEGRQIRFIVVERQTQLASIEVSDADVEAFFADRPEQFSRPEERRARHILVRLDQGASEQERAAASAKAADLLTRLRTGESFDELAKAHSDDPGSAARGGDLGFFGRGAMVPEFDQAAFSTPVGQFAPIVQSTFGYHVIQVTEERPAGPVPIEEVRESIRRQIQQQRAEDAVRAEADRLRAQIDTADALDTVAEAEGYTVQERTVVANDRLADLGPSPAFTSAVFELEPGQVSDPVSLRLGQALLSVAAVLPPSLIPLDEVEGRVRAAILNERSLRAARASAESAYDRHGNVGAAARSLGLDVAQSGAITPAQTLSGAGGTSPELEGALFGPEAETGRSGVAPAPGGAVIYEITRREGFDTVKYGEAKAGLRDELMQLRQGELLQSILQQISEGYDIRVNSDLLARFGA